MSVSLSIKDVPEALAARLRARATANHRSLQRELLAIVEAAAGNADAADGRRPASTALLAASPAAVYTVVRQQQASPPVDGDTLLDELDAIVAGSQWGRAPLLTREQAHDRRLMRETEYDARHADTRGAQPGAASGKPTGTDGDGVA